MGNYLSSCEFNIPGWTIYYDNEDEPRKIIYKRDNLEDINVTINRSYFGYFLVTVNHGFTKTTKSCSTVKDIAKYLFNKEFLK